MNMVVPSAIVVAEESSSFFEYVQWDTAYFVQRYPTISEETIKKVFEGFRTLLEIYFLYGLKRSQGKGLYYITKINKILTNSATRMLDYLEIQGQLEWVAYFKYKCCAFYSFYECEGSDPVPPLRGLDNDLPGIIFGGVIMKFVSLLKKKDPKKFFSFILSINMAKMGMPRPDEAFVANAVKKTEIHLTTQPPPLLPEIYLGIGLKGEGVYLNKETFEQQLRRTVREMYSGSVYTREAHYEPFYPSTNSNYQYSIKDGGCVAAIYKEILDCTYDFQPGNLTDNTISIETTQAVLRAQHSEVYGEQGKLDQELIDNESKEKVTGAIIYDDHGLKKKWIELMDILEKKAYDEQPLVKAIGLSEALKARVISKGPPLLYSYLKPLQKFLWTQLKKNSIFKLIGQPISTDTIEDLFGIMSPEHIIINGDYKASTDNLHSWVSETLADELVKVLNERVTDLNDGYIITERHREMLLRSLTGHIFDLTPPDKPDSKGFNPIDSLCYAGSPDIHFETDLNGRDVIRLYKHRPQKEGQLMGSITSFPFLCLANAAMCRWAMELANRVQYRLCDRPTSERSIKAPLLINGDDCTMKGRRFASCPQTLSLKETWGVITTFGGLSSSVGKTLFSLPHRPVAVINSRTFDYENDHWGERKYVNMGLMLGKKRSVVSGTVEDQVEYGGLGSIHRELLSSTPDVLKTQVSKRFIYYNANTLKKYPNIPWFIPEYLGGPGLKNLVPRSYYDRRLASILIWNQHRDGSFVDKTLQIRKPRSLVEWNLHQIVQRDIESYGVDTQPFAEGRLDLEFDLLPPWEFNYDSLESNYSYFYKMLTINTLFTTPLAGVFTAKTEKTRKASALSSHRTFLLNDRAWAKVRVFELSEKCIGIRVRTDEDIDYEKKVRVVPVFRKS